MQTGAGGILDALLDFVAFDFFNGLAVVVAVVGFRFVVLFAY